VSLSLNVPGFPKSNSTVKAFFDLILPDLKYSLKAHLVEIHHYDAIEICDAAGDFFVVPCPKGSKTLHDLKQICEDLEETHPLGRFIDVDLNDELGNTVSSGKSKLCFFCNEKPAIECRRENAHDQEQLRSFMFSKMAEYCRREREEAITKRLTSLALKALLYEISLTPKPGLVDKFSNGSHADMNYRTFIDSSAAISTRFGSLVHAGFSFKESDLTKALPIVRNIGLRMESAMYESTENINTQKGIIFLMGLSLFACGKLFSENESFETDRFCCIVRGICKDLVKNELLKNTLSAKSHGEDIFLKHGFSGARGEAESGFRSVFEFGLPQLNGIQELNDEVMIKCFLAIASKNDDTNILYRRGPVILSAFQDLCKNALENFDESNYSAVIDFCQNENISPGGSADLFAVTIFVWSVINDPVFTKFISEK
jgi:holo-ACP synthase/triphosphoribosyl-dephospho-CoA synthase